VNWRGSWVLREKEKDKEIWLNENSIIYLKSKVEREIQKQQHEKP
jgi:hypothetical protein